MRTRRLATRGGTAGVGVIAFHEPLGARFAWAIAVQSRKHDPGSIGGS